LRSGRAVSCAVEVGHLPKYELRQTQALTSVAPRSPQAAHGQAAFQPVPISVSERHGRRSSFGDGPAARPALRWRWLRIQGRQHVRAAQALCGPASGREPAEYSEGRAAGRVAEAGICFSAHALASNQMVAWWCECHILSSLPFYAMR